MTKFVYNNKQNANTSYISFELNYRDHLSISFKYDIYLCLKSNSAKKLTKKLKDQISIYQQTLILVQKLQKQVYNKVVKLYSYTPIEKIWLNSKYTRIKQNCKFENKFFGPFYILHPVSKQANNFKLPTKSKIYNIFYILLLKQDITRKVELIKSISCQTQNKSLILETKKYIRQKQFAIEKSMQKKLKVNYQDYIIKYSKKVTQKMKAYKSQLQQSCTF